ncbi:MAG: hypothetical protein OEV85_15195, partial [Candidatus Thorarchaeota archaeon]|nr:hypothetical protein [Candidatus Thorarchaeota archaeon]
MRKEGGLSKLNDIKIKTVVLLSILFASSMVGVYFTSAPSNLNSVDDSVPSSAAPGTAVLIINDPRKYAFFGWYRPTQFSTEILSILNNTILWASSFASPDEVDIVFYSESGDSYASFVRDWLVNGGYQHAKINNQTSANIEEFDTDYYEGIDLVIYWNTNGYDSINVVNSHVPFITVSTMQTDEMGIGSGISTVSGVNDTFHVINTGYYPTQSYPKGPLILDDSYSFTATEASSIGKVLISSEVELITTPIEISMAQNVSILADGSASMTFTITIPESPLSDILREAFFENASALEKDVEYNVPENITVKQYYEFEEGITDVSLLGDVGNRDGKVDMDDINQIASHIGNAIGDDDWISDLDVNWDGKIDVRDLAIAAHNFGKTENNTGFLFVSGYYDGELVNLTNVYYRGPEGSSKINVSESGYVWYHLLPGTYTVFGTFDGTEKNTSASINAGEMAFVELDFGGAPAQVQE